MRYTILIVFFALIWLSLLVRVFYLSIQSNDYYDRLSSQNTIKIEHIAPVRGEIIDRNEKPIAINKLGFRIQFEPHLKHKTQEDVFYKEIDVLMGLLPNLNREKLIKNYLKKDSYYNHNPINVVDFISYEAIMPVYSILNLRENIDIMPAPKRFYPNNNVGAHVIGYVAKANQRDINKDTSLKLIGSVGKSGIEKYYNSYLQGIAGKREIKVSAHNEEIAELSHSDAIEHRNIQLTLDIELQKYIGELFKGKTGAIVVMNTDGAIYAAGSYPDYNLNTFVSGISTKKWKALISSIDAPFTNKIINGLYPPGSTIKTGLGLIYITSGVWSPWRSVVCTGSMLLGKRNFRCWKSRGHKKTGIRKAIRESCDDYFYKGSLKVGIAKMSQELKKFGLGQKTGVDLPNEFIGTVPSRAWKRERYNRPWYIGETVNTSIGQGDFLTTPLQIAQFTALMATGKLPQPHFAKVIGEDIFVPKFKDVLSDEQKKRLPMIQQAMIDVCNHPKGTATHYLSSKVRMAGKTGTAQVIGISQETKKRLKEHEMAYYTRSHAWLTTYAPTRHPTFVVTVLVEHGGHGGAAAGKVVSKIYDWLYDKGYMKKR